MKGKKTALFVAEWEKSQKKTAKKAAVYAFIKDSNCSGQKFVPGWAVFLAEPGIFLPQDREPRPQNREPRPQDRAQVGETRGIENFGLLKMIRLVLLAHSIRWYA